MSMANVSGSQQRRCLIVERHAWETGRREQQLQFVLAQARAFFGPRQRRIRVRVFMPPNAHAPAFEQQIAISREYTNGTRRTNGFAQMGSVPSSFVFFEESGTPNTYDVWWQEDKAIIAARFPNWSQGQNSQYGRGRLSVIVAAPVLRVIDRIDT
jgi:hypothetical protein